MAQEKKTSLLDEFNLDDPDFFEESKGDENEDKKVLDKIKEKTSLDIKNTKSDKQEDENEDEDDEDAFAEFTDTPTKKKVESKKVEKIKGKADEDDEEEEEEEVDETEEADSKDKGKEKDKNKEHEEVAEDYFTNLALDLKDRGILSEIDLPKDKKLTEEEFFQLQDEELERRNTETFEAIFDQVGKDGSDFIKFVQNGGNPKRFLMQISTQFNLDDLDINNEADVNRTLRYYLSKYENIEPDDIQDKMDWLKDSGKIKNYATKYFKVIKDSEKEETDTLIAKQEEVSRAKIEEVKLFNKELVDTLNASDIIGVFKVSKTEQKELASFITKPTVKVGKNNFVPELQAKLSNVLKAKTDKTKKQFLILAKILKDDFELSGLVDDITTKVVAKSKSRISSGKNNIRNISANGNRTKSLADIMDE